MEHFLLLLAVGVVIYLFFGWRFARFRQRLFGRVFGRVFRLEQKSARTPEDRHPFAFYYDDWRSTIAIHERVLAFIFFPMISGEAMRASQAIVSRWRLQKAVAAHSKTKLLLVNLETPLDQKERGRLNRLAVTVTWPITLAWSVLFVPLALLLHAAPALVERWQGLSARRVFNRSHEYLCN